MHVVHAIVVWVCLVGCAALVLVCAIGVMVMRDAYQRLHFIAPPATLSPLLLVVACAVDEPQPSAWMKAAMVTLALGAMNAVVTHATARAEFVRAYGAWPPPDDAPVEPARKDAA